MVDIAMTASRIVGMVTKPQATLADHSRPVPPWHVVAREHVLPLIVLSVVVQIALMWMLWPVYETIYQSAGMAIPDPGNPVVEIALGVAMRFAGIAFWALVIGFFAGTLGGRNDFNAAYLLVALALTPYILASALLPIPVVGFVLWLSGLVYALVILYRAAPALVGVPRENRAKHLVLSLVSMLLAGLAVALLLGPLVTRPMM